MRIKLFKTLGTFWGRGRLKFWGFIGVYPPKTPSFGDRDGVSSLEIFGDGLGTAKPQILGTFGEKSPKKPKFWGGDEGKNLGIFTTLIGNKIFPFDDYFCS